jgi:hypothetical protein
MGDTEDGDEEVIDFLSSGNEKDTFFSILKRKVQTVATSASSAAKAASTAASSAASKLTEAVNVVAKCTQEDIDMEQLGIATEDRDIIWKRFEELLATEANGMKQVKQTITASTFVSDCVKNGQSAKFADATFRTLDHACVGEITKHQYLIGVWLTQVEILQVPIFSILALPKQL